MIFWSVGLCMLLLIGMIEFTGVENTPDGVNLNDLMDQFPRIVLGTVNTFA